MEMRIEKCTQDLGEVIISIENFEMEMILAKNEGDGVVLINEEQEEKFYRSDKIDDLFCLINKNTVNKISYINNDYNSIKINQFYISLLNNEKYTLELL